MEGHNPFDSTITSQASAVAGSVHDARRVHYPTASSLNTCTKESSPGADSFNVFPGIVGGSIECLHNDINISVGFATAILSRT